MHAVVYVLFSSSWLLASVVAEDSRIASTGHPETQHMPHLYDYIDPTESPLTFFEVMGKLHHFDAKFNSSCSMDLIVFMSALMSSKPQIWALTMLDAFGKPGSGLLQGSGQWPGSYSQCRGVGRSKSIRGPTFSGQFCWAHFAIKPQYLQIVTPGKYSDVTVKTAICVPDTCSDVQLLGAAKLLTEWQPIPYLDLTNVECPQEPIIWENKSDLAALILLCVFVVLVFVGTLYDLYPRDKTEKNEDGAASATEKRPFLLVFSAYTNGKKLLSLDGGKQCLPAINGVRVISMFWIIVGHTLLVTLVFIDNAKTYIDDSRSFRFVTIAQAVFAVDTFLFLSGFLVAITYLNEYERSGGRISWLKFYLHRYWRLTPTYLLIIWVVFASLGKYAGHGPFWVRPFYEAIVCKKYWWANALYINNFMPNDEQCMTHSWYLANDMQFYILSPLFLIPFTKSGRWSLFTALVMIAASSGISGILGYSYGFPIAIDFFDSPPGTEGYDEGFRILYSKPYARIGPYIIGLLTGGLIQKTSNITIPKPLVVFGWLIALTTISTVVYALCDVGNMSVATKTLYHTFARVAWAAAIAWIIVACCSGNGGIIKTILSWPIWNPLSRLTYCTFLWHPAAIFITMGSTEVTTHYTFNSVVMTAAFNIIFAYGGALIISLLFEAPFVGIESILLRGKNNYKRLSRQAERSV